MMGRKLPQGSDVESRNTLIVALGRFETWCHFFGGGVGKNSLIGKLLELKNAIKDIRADKSPTISS